MKKMMLILMTILFAVSTPALCVKRKRDNDGEQPKKLRKLENGQKKDDETGEKKEVSPWTNDGEIAFLNLNYAMQNLDVNNKLKCPNAPKKKKPAPKKKRQISTITVGSGMCKHTVGDLFRNWNFDHDGNGGGSVGSY